MCPMMTSPDLNPVPTGTVAETGPFISRIRDNAMLRWTPMRALLFVPGLLGTALIVGGFISETYGMVGAGFGVAGVAAVGMLVLKAREWAAEAAERKRIWASGTAATARVVAIAEAPGSGDDNPEVDLQLDIAGDNVKVRSLISRLAIPRI